MNWNVTASPERNQIVRLAPLLQADLADVIVLQEAYWGWLRTDSTIQALYPHQFVHTQQASSGLIVLSRYPVLEHGTGSQLPNVEGFPRLVWAKLDVGRSTPLWIVAAHPESPYTSNRSDCRFPQCYDTQQRDLLIPQIRTIIDTALSQNAPVLLVGDLNITERESQYHEVGRGLLDSHRQAGWGWGTTFGVFFTESSENINGRFLVPLLRFDYMFNSPNITALSSETDCSLRGSEHCIVYARFALH
jgi:endonuclease/exonuclease/phosphatase (EEP) superfamily protein YafD